MLIMGGYKFADGCMINLTPIQCEMVMWAQVAINGGTVPRPYITEEEYETSLTRKSTVQEFSKAMKKAQETQKPYEDVRAEMEKKAQEMGIKDVY